MATTCRHILLIPLLFALSAPVETLSANDSLTEQERVLEIIADFADRLCKDIPLTGHGENLDLSGRAKVELSGIIKKIADLGVEGAVKYQKTEYEGLLQKDLAKALERSTDCRLQIWNDLKVKILSTSGLDKPSTPQKPPYAIYDTWGKPRFSFGTFTTDNECLDKLFTAQQQLDVKNAAKCARLPEKMWCLSSKDFGFKNVAKDCHESKQDCMDTLMLHELEVDAGGKRVMTSCELVTWSEL